MGSLGKVVLFAAVFTASSLFGRQDSAPPPDNPSQAQPAQPQNQSQPENQSQPQNQSPPASPDQAQPSTPPAEPSQSAAPQTGPAQQQPSTQSPVQQENTPSAQQENKPKTKPKATHHNTHKKTTAKPTTKSGATSRKKSQQNASTKKPSTKGPTIIVDQTGKVVVRNGGASSDPVEISPGITKEQELHDRENTEQLLATTETNLKSVEGRQLTPAQQSTLDQIHAYVRQAKAASAAGDTTRARTLASKANLLAVELAKK